MSAGPTKLISHGHQVRALYKAAVRNLQSHYATRYQFRYEATMMRARFDEHRDEKDMLKAVRLVEEGEKELFAKMHPQPFKFHESPGGGAYGREAIVPDWILDMWHPLERLQYPEYFARRDQRKLEYIERYEKKYGKPQENH